MVNCCACAGCKNTGHRLHGFPKDRATLRQWVRFSLTSVTVNTRICSAHFREEDYDPRDVRMVSLGLKTERLAKLIPTTVPSVHTHPSACPATRPRAARVGAARRKREVATVSPVCVCTVGFTVGLCVYCSRAVCVLQ